MIILFDNNNDNSVSYSDINELNTNINTTNSIGWVSKIVVKDMDTFFFDDPLNKLPNLKTIEIWRVKDVKLDVNNILNIYAYSVQYLKCKQQDSVIEKSVYTDVYY